MKFSVVIPVYNGEATLRGAVETLRSQDFADWEAVLVDDGSRDGTPDIAAEMARGDSRIRVFRQANAGVSVARNRGLAEARGDWIAWLDADDAYVPGTLARVAALVDAHAGCSAFHFPCLEFSGDGVACRPCPSPAHERFGGRDFSGADAFRILYADAGTAALHWQPWRFVHRRDALPRFRPGVIHEDVDVLPLQMAGLPRVHVARDPFYVYRPARAGAATEFFTPRRVRDILDVTAHVLSDLDAAPLPADSKRGFRATLAYNLFGFWRATPHFPEPDRSELLDAFAAHPEWLLAIAAPPRTAWLKRLLLRMLGPRRAAVLLASLERRPRIP